MDNLIEELRRNGYSQTDINRELRRKRLQHYGLREPRYLVGFYTILSLGYLSTVAKILDVPVLHFLLKLPTIDFPLIITSLGAIFSLLGLLFTFYAVRDLRKREGAETYYQSFGLIREGPYKNYETPHAVRIYRFLGSHSSSTQRMDRLQHFNGVRSSRVPDYHDSSSI